jgi:hypothetical protein
MDSRAKSIIRDWERGNADRSTFLTHWQEITRYMQPNRADYTMIQPAGAKRMQWVYDATPIWALEQFAAGLHALLTSPTLKWFALKCEDERVDQIPTVRAWLEAATTRLYTIFNSPKHNFASQSHEIYSDLGGIGNGCMAVLEHPRIDVLFSTRHLKEVVWAENDTDRIDTLTRKWEFTPAQAVGAFGKDAGEKVGKAYQDGKTEKVTYVHQVRPRSLRNVLRSEAAHKAFSSTYVSMADGEVIREGGFDEFPYLCPRLSKATAEIYGRGNGSTALPDVKMLNEMAKIVLKASQKVLDPPLDLPDQGYLVPIKTTPGSLNFHRANVRADDRIKPIETGGQPQLGDAMIEAIRNQILRAFYVDLLRMPTDLSDPSGDGKGSTATYWMQRREKEMMALSPMLARVNAEWTDPLIDRVFAIEFRRAKLLRFGPGSPFPPPPPELSGTSLHVDYVSPIALAQRSSETDSLDRLMEKQMVMKQMDPQAPMVVNTEETMRLYGRDLNVPVGALKTRDQMQAEAQAQAEAQQQAAQAKQAETMAGAAKSGADALATAADIGQRQAA